LLVVVVGVGLRRVGGVVFLGVGVGREGWVHADVSVGGVGGGIVVAVVGVFAVESVGSGRGGERRGDEEGWLVLRCGRARS